jgi:hypothetical protein
VNTHAPHTAQAERATKAQAKAREAVAIKVAGAKEADPAAAIGAKEAKDSGARAKVAEAKVCLLPVTCLKPAHLCVRERLVKWELIKAPVDVLQVIREGVLADWPCPPLPLWPTVRSTSEVEKVLPLVADYIAAGALLEVPWSNSIQFLIPWFVLTKREPSGDLKHRLIADCRLLNQHLSPPQFRLENIQMVFPVLRKGMFGVKVDLKKRLLSPGSGRCGETIPVHAGRGKVLSVARSTIWAVHPT